MQETEDGVGGVERRRSRCGKGTYGCVRSGQLWRGKGGGR